MTNLNGRLAKLEDEAERQKPEVPFLILSQSLDDDDLYHAGEPETGKQYRRAELPELGKRYQLILIDYAKDWRAVVG